MKKDKRSARYLYEEFHNYHPPGPEPKNKIFEIKIDGVDHSTVFLRNWLNVCVELEKYEQCAIIKKELDRRGDGL